MTSLAALGGTAMAQASDAAQPEPEGDIVVTAQKRAENVQEVPISIAAFSAEGLQKSNVAGVQDLGRVATNFYAFKGLQAASIRLNIRGIGAVGAAAIEPSVAVFMDDIYLPRAGAIVGSMLDMESVEVLRGPQGTLFGRNASVGALSLHSATPKPDFSARVTGEIGNGDRYKLDGYINVPVTDTVAVRLAGMRQWFGGYWHNALDGRQYGGTDDTVLRGSVRADFGNVVWTVRADYAKSTGDGVSNVDFDRTSVSPAQLDAFRSRLGGLLPDTNLDDRIFNSYITAKLNDRQWGVSSHLDWDVANATVRLINSYRKWRNDQLDGDGLFTPAPITSRRSNFRSGSQSHELQFISPQGQWLGGALDAVAGLYYFKEEYDISEKLQLNSQFCNILVPLVVRPACNATLAAGRGVDATDQQVHQRARSFAAYGQATFHLTPTLSLALGARWTQDKKSGDYAQRVNNPFAAVQRAVEILTFPDLSDNRLTYRASLNYKPNDDLLFFVNHSTGYKSGGYNSGAGNVALSTFDANGNLISTQRVFDRETVKNYEVGAKTSWLDDSLTANVTFFRMDISGFQDRAFNGTSFTVLNAGNLRQQGFELDLVARPTRRFRVSASLAYLDSGFTDYPNAAGLPGLGGTQDLKGAPVTYSPEFSGRFGFDWSGDVGGSGMSWNVASDLSFVSDQYQGQVNDGNPQTIEDGYALLGARLTLNGPDDRWSLAVFGSNLTNTQYSNSNFYQVLDGVFGLRNGVFPGSTAVRRIHGDPRTYGASLTVRF
ncbi:TonB-dependent receptor [Sphingobium sp.]|uniref:TonB-dependent receptor n=1 Tax=Sphingobium sp. TaxID=1912891 RepID=UPI0028BDB92B|nr:TonB-dependent receptor [Sphingobium sp.]